MNSSQSTDRNKNDSKSGPQKQHTPKKDQSPTVITLFLFLQTYVELVSLKDATICSRYSKRLYWIISILAIYRMCTYRMVINVFYIDLWFVPFKLPFPITVNHFS